MLKMQSVKPKSDIYRQLNFLARFIWVETIPRRSSMWKVTFIIFSKVWYTAVCWFGSVHIAFSVMLEQDSIINWEDYNEIIVFNFVWIYWSGFVWERFVAWLDIRLRVYAKQMSEFGYVCAMCVQRNLIKIMLFLLNALINRVVSLFVSRLFNWERECIECCWAYMFGTPSLSWLHML